eukprot:TRINITY_DN2406_c0_g1_i3.p1 TRINITY_DN2406_c0_g1~~TRINITY_DN2406_c0_g1_i3.p1  ORF type:complete len:289 (+),score=-41.07 TRINITY_DN2406_c0_g1_i3:356-1222(+)
MRCPFRTILQVARIYIIKNVPKQRACCCRRQILAGKQCLNSFTNQQGKLIMGFLANILFQWQFYLQKQVHHLASHSQFSFAFSKGWCVNFAWLCMYEQSQITMKPKYSLLNHQSTKKKTSSHHTKGSITFHLQNRLILRPLFPIIQPISVVCHSFITNQTKDQLNQNTLGGTISINSQITIIINAMHPSAINAMCVAEPHPKESPEGHNDWLKIVRVPCIGPNHQSQIPARIKTPIKQNCMAKEVWNPTNVSASEGMYFSMQREQCPNLWRKQRLLWEKDDVQERTSS